jgi:hypothetical protein
VSGVREAGIGRQYTGAGFRGTSRAGAKGGPTSRKVLICESAVMNAFRTTDLMEAQTAASCSGVRPSAARWRHSADRLHLFPTPSSSASVLGTKDCDRLFTLCSWTNQNNAASVPSLRHVSSSLAILALTNVHRLFAARREGGAEHVTRL